MKLKVTLEIDAILHPDCEKLTQTHFEELQIRRDVERFFTIPIQREINSVIITNMAVINLESENYT